MRSWFVRLATLTCVLLCVAPTLSYGAGEPEAETQPASGLESVPAGQQLDSPSPPSPQASFVVNLQIDGNLVGRIRLSQKNREPIPLSCHVFFMREGEVVQSVHTDQAGHFQVTSLIPGRYFAVVNCPTGRAGFEVDVLAHDAEATAEQMLLDVLVSLVPLDGGILLQNVCPLCGEPVVLDAGCGCEESCGVYTGGSCCPPPRHPWGLLGLAGLAGLAGIDGDGGEKPVSPFKPRTH